MGDNQETMVEKFMDTSLLYLQGASKHGLYSMVIQCLEVCLCCKSIIKLLCDEIVILHIAKYLQPKYFVTHC